MSDTEILSGGLKELGIDPDPEKIGQLLAYHALLRKWNRVYNLTSVRDPREMLTLHLLDSLAVLPHLDGGNCLDIGTGPGLPGIPLAIFSPERQFVLLDSNQKKTRFVQQAIIELGLKNVSVVAERLEKFQPNTKFDIIISRAFAQLSEMIAGAAHLIDGDGCFYAMKGRHQEEETRFLGNQDFTIVPLHVPGVPAQRHLIIVPASAAGFQG